MKRFVLYPLEAALMAVFFGVMRALPIDLASSVGGAVARIVGPRLSASRRAERNLRLAFQDKSAAERAAIIGGMWENLGRVAAEYPHLYRISAPVTERVEVVNAEHVYELAGSGSPAILVGGHLGNWEIPSVFAAHAGINLASVMRAQNNRLSQRILDYWRTWQGGERIAKGSQGAKQAMGVLKRGGVLGLLFDQKMNDGIPVTLFGHDAMTAAAPAQLAIRFGCPLIPIRVERTRGARFRITCYAPLKLPDTGDRHADAATLTRSLNELLEDWIRERPDQWFWLHRRWPDEAYSDRRLTPAAA